MDYKTDRIADSSEDSLQHPFRQMLSKQIESFSFYEVNSSKDQKEKKPSYNEGVSLFLLSFAAFFTTFYTFIA